QCQALLPSLSCPLLQSSLPHFLFGPLASRNRCLDLGATALHTTPPIHRVPNSMSSSFSMGHDPAPRTGPRGARTPLWIQTDPHSDRLGEATVLGKIFRVRMAIQPHSLWRAHPLCPLLENQPLETFRRPGSGSACKPV